MSAPWRALLLVALLCSPRAPAAAQEPPEAQLGPAPIVTDPSQWATTAPGPVHAALAPVDRTSRQAVVDFYNSVYVPAAAVPNDWTGSVAGCDPGTTSAAYADATLNMVNYFRAMVGLPAAIPRVALKDQKSQAAALMMTANNSLSHSPPTSWTCYSAEGAEAAGKSNLALGVAGAPAIALYIQDPGSSNTALGHRRWILYPRQTQMGTGSSNRSNDLWVIGDFGTRPATPEFVAWPTAGFVPYRLVYPRWSFSVNTSSTVSFSGATVVMSLDGASVPLTVLPNATGYGDNTIAWEPSALGFQAGMPDRSYAVQVRNVMVGGVAKTYSYTVTAIDPAAPATTHALTVQRAGAGDGIVTSAPPGISCGADCVEAYPAGAVVTFTATPAGGSEFTGWSGGGCSGTGTCAVTVNAATTVTATFDPQARVLTVLKTGAGAGTITSTPSGIACGADCSEAYPPNAVVTLTAAPSPGSLFEGWGGAGCLGTGACTLTMAADVTVTASFASTATTFTRYLAEGATSRVFDTRLAILNPGPVATVATLSFQRAGLPPLATTVTVPARQRVTVDPKDIPGLESAEFSTLVTSDQLLVVDRTMHWSGGQAYGAHAETSTLPAPTWLLAEGATHSGFDLFYLLQNPSSSATTVRVRYLRPAGPPLEKDYVLPPASRTNIWVNHEVFGGAGAALSATDVSAVIESLDGTPIIVERAMYAAVPGQVFGAGHESAGVTAPATSWFLAEGATGDYFDLFVLVANPSGQSAEVRATYLLPGGETLEKRYTVAANSRFNIWVDREDARLADTAVSTTVESLNGVPLIVERAMWWPGDWTTWHEAHNSAGATTTGTRWALAEGEVDAGRGMETYILVANASATPAVVEVTLLFADGTSATRRYEGLAGRSRHNVPVGQDFPEAGGKRFGAIVESVGAAPAQIVVERAMYWDAAGQRWAAGTNALATKLPEAAGGVR